MEWKSNFNVSLIRIHIKEFCYIIMEYVEGETLKKCCRPQHLLPIDQCIEIVFKVCSA